MLFGRILWFFCYYFKKRPRTVFAFSEDCSSQGRRGRNPFFFQKAPSYLLCPRQAHRLWIFKVSSERCKWTDCHELEVIKTTYWDNRPIQSLLCCSLFSIWGICFYGIKFSVCLPMHRKGSCMVPCLCQQKRNVFASTNDWLSFVGCMCEAVYGQMGNTWNPVSAILFLMKYGAELRL